MKPMSPLLVRTPSGESRRVCSLLPGIRVHDVAEACRNAALGFALNAQQGWGRPELARWLVGPYAEAVAATRSLRVSGTRAAVVHRPVEEDTIQELLGTTRTEVLELLRAAPTWTHDGASVRASLDEGLVAGIVDEASDLGFAPLDSGRMRLAARVRSLFIADYLTRPRDYESFTICTHCDTATFDAEAHRAECTHPQSGTQPPGGAVSDP
jgi:hypothetical protein